MVGKIREEGIHITQESSEFWNADGVMIVIENLWKYIKSENAADTEFDLKLQDIRKRPERYIFITFQKQADYNDLPYVKRKEVLFLEDDLSRLLEKLKKFEKPCKRKSFKFTKLAKLLLSAGGLAAVVSLIAVVANFALKAPEIPVPHFEIKWRYLSAYQYHYINRLNNVKVEKKAKPIMNDWISKKIEDPVVVAVITLRNIGNEFPDNTIVHMERLQDGHVYEEPLDLKTVAHKNYIMIPVFMTEEFPMDTDLLSLTKEEIWDQIDDSLIFKPTAIRYEKARFWSWQKEEEIEVKESSDVLSKLEISLDEPNESEIESLGEMDIQSPFIQKYMIIGQ